MKKNGKIKNALGPNCIGLAILGERGQIVIPKEIRELQKLKKGDQFMVLLNNDAVVLIPKQKMEIFINQVTKSLR
jgi:AbrB family looped-hinge helix DNA binding protein